MIELTKKQKTRLLKNKNSGAVASLGNKKKGLAALNERGNLKSANETEKSDFLSLSEHPFDQQRLTSIPSSLTKEIEKLAYIDCEQCTPWAFSDRSEAEMGDIESLASSISNSSQQEPALVRPVKTSKTSKIKFEIIFGHRRWKACSLLGKPLKAIIKNINDQEAAVAQKEENENRENISDYSRGMYYKQLLDSKIFSSMRELSLKMHISRSTLNDLLSFTRINKKIFAAITNPHKLPTISAIKLSQLSDKFIERNIDNIMNILPKIISGKIPSAKIHGVLESPSYSENPVKEKKIIKSKSGNNLFSTQEHMSGAYTITIYKAARELINIKEINKMLSSYFISKTKISEDR